MDVATANGPKKKRKVRDSLNELFGPLKAFCLVCDCTLNPVKQIDSSRVTF